MVRSCPRRKGNGELRWGRIRNNLTILPVPCNGPEASGCFPHPQSLALKEANSDVSMTTCLNQEPRRKLNAGLLSRPDASSLLSRAAPQKLSCILRKLLELSFKKKVCFLHISQSLIVLECTS